MVPQRPEARVAATAQHPAPHDTSAGELLTTYLNEHASAFLRALRLRQDEDPAADGLLRRSAGRLSANLHTFAQLTDPEWAERLHAELTWLVGALAREHEYAARLARLVAALQRLSGAQPQVTAVGVARAEALLDRQLTLARTRGHSAALRALGSSRFHALADAVAVLASEVPLRDNAVEPAARALQALADQAHQRLAKAAAALPLGRAAIAYNGEALHSALDELPLAPQAEPDAVEQDAPWHQVRALTWRSRYALEVCGRPDDPLSAQLDNTSRILERHRDAAEAAAAAAAAARTPRIAPATAYALGVLHADQRQEVEAARYAFSRLWHRSMPSVS